MITSEIQANPDLSHRIARVSKIMFLQLGMTPVEMSKLAYLVHHVKSYEDILNASGRK
jgi:hypothetical protein